MGVGYVLLEHPTCPTWVNLQKPEDPEVDGFYRIYVDINDDRQWGGER